MKPLSKDRLNYAKTSPARRCKLFWIASWREAMYGLNKGFDLDAWRYMRNIIESRQA